MTISSKTTTIYADITREGIELGDLRAIAKEIKKDQQMAEELWATGELYPRLLSILIMDKKTLTADKVDLLLADIEKHSLEERTQLADWLMANQLTKDKKTTTMLEGWRDDPSPIKRRLFWYHQGRLRWVGQQPPDNTAQLLAAIEKRLLNEVPEVQWAMNFTAGWIGVFDLPYREACIQLGEKLGLYKDEVVPKGCSPNYLPKFIVLEIEKRKL